MKVSPVRHSAPPKYPTWAEARQNPGAVTALPARWAMSPGLAAWLGMVALAVRARAGEGADGPAPAGQVRTAGEDPAVAPDPGNVARQMAAVVAPLLAEALENDGRGSFGCVAVNPPSFLAEDEALELIWGELEAAGLKLEYGVVLENVPGPVETEKTGRAHAGGGEDYLFRGPQIEVAPGRFLFDWADAERGIYVEYLAAKDYGRWEAPSASTVQSYDFADLARRAAAAFGQYRGERPTYFGVFFDPLAYSGVIRPPVAGLTPAQQRLAEQESDRLRETEGNANARAKLREQVRHFVECLRQEGVVVAAPK